MIIMAVNVDVEQGNGRRGGYGPLVLRIALGVVFLAHAVLKWMVLTLPGAAEFFAAHGFPGWSAYLVFALELVGGSLLVVGVLTRWVALTLLPVMAGAFIVHFPNGWYFASPGGGWEYIAFLSAALLVQASLGSGTLALQDRFRRTRGGP
jgi:putative oxidoreductase